MLSVLTHKAVQQWTPLLSSFLLKLTNGEPCRRLQGKRSGYLFLYSCHRLASFLVWIPQFLPGSLLSSSDNHLLISFVTSRLAVVTIPMLLAPRQYMVFLSSTHISAIVLLLNSLHITHFECAIYFLLDALIRTKNAPSLFVSPFVLSVHWCCRQGNKTLENYWVQQHHICSNDYWWSGGIQCRWRQSVESASDWGT